MKKNKEQIKQAEADFQKWQTIYRNTICEKDRKLAWDNMFLLVQDAISNLSKAKLKGVKCPDFEGKVVDATCVVMGRIEKGLEINKLSSYCHWPILEVFYDRKLKFEERAISYDGMLECQLLTEKG